MQYKIKSLIEDPLYNSELIARFINRIMKNGKKSVAQKLVYDAFKQIEDKGEKPLDVFQRAINNISPKVEVRSRRVGGASYQVPTEVRGNRRTSLAIRWLIQAASKRSNKEYKRFSEKLAVELLEASKGVGEAIKRKDSTHKMAEANRVFSHFRW